MNNKIKLALLSTAFMGFSVSDDAVASSNVFTLNAVTVVATRTEQNVKDVPLQVSVVQADAPAITNSAKVSDILRKVPGLEISGGPRRNGEEIRLRGYSSEGVILMVDGKKQNFNSAHDGRFFLDPSLVKQVEVIRGPASASYGAGGLGGVIAFETKDAADFVEGGKSTGAEASFGFQSASSEFLASLTGYTVGDDYDAVANINRRRSFDIDLGNGTSLSSDDEIYSGLLKFTYDINDENSITFDYQGYYGDSKEQNNPQAVSGSSSTNLVKKDNIVNQVGLEHNFNPDSNKIDLTTRIYYVDTEVEEEYLEASSLNAVGDVLTRQLSTIGFNLDNISEFQAEEHNHSLTYGFEFLSEDQEGTDSSATTRNGVPNAEATYSGVYLQDEIKIPGVLGSDDSELYIVPAARFDHYRSSADSGTLATVDESRLSPKIATNLKFNEHYNIFGSYSHAFRAPTLTEKYASGVHFPTGPFTTNNFVANPNLRPETSEVFEFGAGVDFESVITDDDRLTAKASRYFIEAEDYINQVITATTTTFTNVAEASLWGYEGEVNYENSLVDTAFTVAYITGKDDNSGAFLNTIHPIVFTSDIAFKIPEIDAVVGHFGKYSAEHDKVNTAADARGGYGVHNLYFSWAPEAGKFKNYKVDLGVDNIFDQAYTETFASNYEVGRNFKARLTIKLN